MAGTRVDGVSLLGFQMGVPVNPDLWCREAA
jgi:hypothetical protein